MYYTTKQVQMNKNVKTEFHIHDKMSVIFCCQNPDVFCFLETLVGAVLHLQRTEDDGSMFKLEKCSLIKQDGSE